jgi:hypothetical protein
MKMMTPPSTNDEGPRRWSTFGPDGGLRAVNVCFPLEVKSTMCFGSMWKNSVPMLCILVFALFYFHLICYGF